MQKLQLSIPEPCHENWYGMTPTEQGRYCNACAKEVVDFSMMTDTEVLNYFTTITNEKVCGRALPSQLDRAITWPKEPKKRLFWYWNYIVMFFMFFTKANTVKAQGGIKPVTELNPVKPEDIKGDIVMTNWVVKGRVTDRNGDPVSFATIKIKGTRYGVPADVNGDYTIKVGSNDILLVSATSFQETEITIGAHRIINVILDNGNFTSGLFEIIVGGETDLKDLKHIAALTVRDDESRLPLRNAKIIIVRRSNNFSDTSFTDKKGRYSLKGLKENEEYFIKVETDGYGVSEFIINADNFKDKKKEWEVLLTRQEDKSPGIKIPLRKPCPGAIVKLDDIVTKNDSIYVLDGAIMPGKVDINPDDVEEYKILQAAEAIALFGQSGSNGAVVITTRQAKIKTLENVTVKTECTRKLGGMTGGVFVHVSRTADLKARINTFINDSLKVYPNPVQRGNTLKISLKLKQTGNHNIQITDGAGRIVLQKQTNIQTKEYIEQVQTDSRWSSGLYYIRVFDNNKKLISNSSFIVQ